MIPSPWADAMTPSPWSQARRSVWFGVATWIAVALLGTYPE